MYKIILGFAALGLASLSLTKQGEIDFLTKKWKVVMDKTELAQRDSMFQQQLKSIDTMTVFPEEILEMKKQMAFMPADSVATLPVDLVYLVNSADLDEFKVRMKKTAIQMNRSEDSTMRSRVVVFEFEKSGVLKRFESEKPEEADTSTLYTYNSSKRILSMFANPAVFGDELPGDTVSFNVLYLDNDSMSIRIDPTKTEVSQHNMKPMNFVSYKQEERER